MAAKYYFVAANGNGSWGIAGNWYNGSGGTGGTAGVPTATDDAIINAASGTGTLTVGFTAVCNSLDMTGFTGTFAGTFALTISTITGTKTLVLGSGTIWSYAGALTLGGVVGGTITCNGNTFTTGNITFNGIGAVWTMTDTFSYTNAVILTAGSISGTTINVGGLSSNNSNIRSFSFTNLYLTSAGTVLSIATQTGLTWSLTNIYVTNGTSTANTITTNGIVGATNIYLAGSGSGTITYTNTSGGSYTPNVYVTNSGGANIAFGASTFNVLQFVTGTNAIYNSIGTNAITLMSDLTFCTSCTITAVNGILLAGSGNVTMSGKTIGSNAAAFTINTSGTYTFVDTFSSNAVVATQMTITNGTAVFNSDLILTATLSFTAGTLTTNGNVICSTFSSSNTNIRTLNMGNRLWSITGTGASAWLISVPTNMTLNCQNSTIKFTDTNIGFITLSLGGLTYNNIWIDKPSSGGNTITVNGSTIANFKITPPNAATTLSIPQGATINFGEFIVNGSPGALITITRTGGTPSTFNKITPGIISCNYLGGSNVNANPDNTWYVGPYSTGSFLTYWKLTTPTQRMLGCLGAG